MKTKIINFTLQLCWVFTLTGFASMAIAQQTWLPNRSAAGSVTIDFLGASQEFSYERSNDEIFTGFSVGHNLPKVANHLFYNLSLDGYGGLPFGSCLRRGYLLPNSDPNKALCTANENKDLMRVWDNRNPNLKNVVLKNMTIKNAFRTYNVVDGDVVKTSSAIPHTDTLQTFYLGSSQENPDWLVIQDTDIRNSDTSLMISSGARFKGVLYHNLHTGCDAEFQADAAQRTRNDHATFTGNSDPRTLSCTNAMNIGTIDAALVWLVEVSPGGGGANVGVVNGGDRVVVVGNQQGDFPIQTRDSNRKQIPHPNVHYYADIETALATESRRPPLLELSCAGWSNPPSNCESRRGFFGGSGMPIDSGSNGGSSGGAGEPDGSDRPPEDSGSSTNPPSQAPTNAAPVAHWRLDETTGTTASNSAGSGAGGLVGLAATQWDSNNARVGRSSLRFDGGSERVSLGNVDFGNDQISLMGWINPSNIGSNNGEGRILSKASGADSQSHYWMLSTDENGSGAIVPRVRLKTGTNTITLLGDNSSEVQNNQWAHIAATYDGSQLTLYYNGRVVGSAPVQGAVARNGNVPAAIGNQPLGGRGFEGLIDDVCIFDKAITRQEVEKLYNGGAGLSCEQLVQSTSNTPPIIRSTGNSENTVMAPILFLLDSD